MCNFCIYWGYGETVQWGIMNSFLPEHIKLNENILLAHLRIFGNILNSFDSSCFSSVSHLGPLNCGSCIVHSRLCLKKVDVVPCGTAIILVEYTAHNILSHNFSG